jgi:hypothetical protein
VFPVYWLCFFLLFLAPVFFVTYDLPFYMAMNKLLKEPLAMLNISVRLFSHYTHALLFCHPLSIFYFITVEGNQNDFLACKKSKE